MKVIVLRHDVDMLPGKSLEFAKIQNDHGISGSYYFRALRNDQDEKIITQITGLGHEIGYHYENIVFARQKIKGKKQKEENDEDFDKYVAKLAIEIFIENLEKLRKIVPINTICMHGSPMSRWDSRLLWKYYDYRDFGISGEPYFDIDFNKVLYLTDTGRRWDGEKVNVRDKWHSVWNPSKSGSVLPMNFISQTHEVPASQNMEQKENGFKDWKVQPKINSAMRMSQEAIRFQQQYNFRSTFDIIKAAEENRLPDKIMLTFHPQRWTDKPLPWTNELVWQNIKNIGKYFLIKMRNI